MISNKEALSLFEIGTFSETFRNYLQNKKLDDKQINNFITKASQIYEKLSTQRKDIGMLVGKVQSGKTTVFSGVIAKYFDEGYDLCIILTSIENLLNNQTNERMKQIFNSKQPCKVNIFNYDDFAIRNTNKRIEKVSDDFKHGYKYIITILKNKQIDKINEILSQNKIWKNKKILIVDDEADLASTGSNEHQETRFANNAIKNLLNNLNQYNYLSVTATPQAQVLINEDDAVKPKHVFTYEPGTGYMGIEEFFNDDKYFQFINQEEWDKNELTKLPNSLKQAIIHYIISVAFLILNKNKIEPTTMLIHTSVAIEEHYKLLRLIIKFKDHVLLYLNQQPNSLEYLNTVNEFKSVFDKFNTNDNIIFDQYFIQLIKKIIKYTNVNVINSESDDTIVENIANIVLGSKKVERGVTLDNLLLTYITNFHEGTTAVDTILQRARWFGYRQGIKDFLNIYMIKSLYVQYKQYILPAEKELWNRLKEAEINDNFLAFEKYISLDGKSAPTNKVKTKHSSSEKILFYDAHVSRPLEVERNAKSIYLLFNHYQRQKINIVNRSYTAILDLHFLDFCNQIKEHKIYETLGIDKYFWDEIKQKANNYQFMIIFFDEANHNDFRERTPENNKYQLFEGVSEDSLFPGEQNLYKIDGLNDKVIIGLHKIRDKLDNKLKYYVSLHLPKNNDFVGKFYVE